MTTRNSLSNQKTLVHHLSSRQQQRHATKNFPAAIFQNFFFLRNCAFIKTFLRVIFVRTGHRVGNLSSPKTPDLVSKKLDSSHKIYTY